MWNWGLNLEIWVKVNKDLILVNNLSSVTWIRFLMISLDSEGDFRPKKSFNIFLGTFEGILILSLKLVWLWLNIFRVKKTSNLCFDNSTESEKVIFRLLADLFLYSGSPNKFWVSFLVSWMLWHCFSKLWQVNSSLLVLRI